MQRQWCRQSEDRFAAAAAVVWWLMSSRSAGSTDLWWQEEDCTEKYAVLCSALDADTCTSHQAVAHAAAVVQISAWWQELFGLMLLGNQRAAPWLIHLQTWQ